MKNVALIPARSGSKRIKDKNIYEVDGHPLLAYTICAARQTSIFSKIILVTDSIYYSEIGLKYGATSDYLRPKNISTEHSSDIEWLSWCVDQYGLGTDVRIFVLRPTSPLRQAETIVRAANTFSTAGSKYHSLRALSPATQHPAKMWTIRDETALPILPYSDGSGVPWHNLQKPSLPKVYIQNASLEIIDVENITTHGSLSGSRIMPFISEGYEGFDINEPEDLDQLHSLVSQGKCKLPKIILDKEMPMQSLRQGDQPTFLKPQDLGERPWGTEELLVLVPNKYMLKKLTIKKGFKGGFQYHRLKDECGVLISGSLLVRFDNGQGGVAERVIKSI